MSNLFSLEGKVALVTGASRGIGEEIAHLLAAHGAHVIVSSRKIDACHKVASSIKEAGFSAEPHACHVGEMSSIANMFSFLKTSHDGLDILINNAATNPYFGNILDTPVSAFEKVVDVNLRGYFFMSVEAAKIMRRKGGGVILNTASVNALSPGEGQAVYSMTKAAVVNMTKAFAKECGQYNIRVNALLPGLTRTQFAGALFEQEDIYAQALKNIPLAREAAPSEQAGAALYLVSDAASYTTGASLVVDGGMMA